MFLFLGKPCRAPIWSGIFCRLSDFVGGGFVVVVVVLVVDGYHDGRFCGRLGLRDCQATFVYCCSRSGDAPPQL